MVIGRNQNTAQKRSRRPYPNQYYSGETPQLMPFQAENLALRLVTDVATLRNKREILITSELVRWCKDRDPSNVGWRYDSGDKLYYPVK